mgnify:CR=1 FL=1
MAGLDDGGRALLGTTRKDAPETNLENTSATGAQHDMYGARLGCVPVGMGVAWACPVRTRSLRIKAGRERLAAVSRPDLRRVVYDQPIRGTRPPDIKH